MKNKYYKCTKCLAEISVKPEEEDDFIEECPVCGHETLQELKYN